MVSNYALYQAEKDKEWFGNKVYSIAPIKKVQFITADIGWSIHGVDTRLSKSYDGGKSWFDQGDMNGWLRDIYCFDMVNSYIGWAVGDNGAIYYSTTGGE